MKRKLFCLSILSLLIVGCENTDTVKNDTENQENDIVENADNGNKENSNFNENNNLENNENDLNNKEPENNNQEGNSGNENPNDNGNNTGDEQPKQEKILPLITKIDLTDSKLVFCGSSYLEGEEPNEERELTDDVFKYGQIYKINSNNEIERVKISTENSDDDLNFTSECDFSLFDIDEEYFKMYVSPRQEAGQYLVSKKTGECRFISYYDFGFSTFKKGTSSVRRYINRDKYGNYYGMDITNPDLYSGNVLNRQLVKTSIGENFVLNTVRISKEEHPYDIEETFAIDKDGNAAYAAESTEKGNLPVIFHYVTVDGQDFTIESSETTTGRAWTSDDSWSFNGSTKAFWQGYDGEIYTNENGYICKLVQNKDLNGEIVSIEQVPVSEKTDIPLKLFNDEESYVYFDDLQEIYLLDQGWYEEGSKDNSPAKLYCVYGPNIGKKVFTGLYYDSHGDSMYGYGHTVASKDSIYIIRGGINRSQDIVTRINVKDNFSTKTFNLEYDASDCKVTRDNKMYVTSYTNFKHIELYDFETGKSGRVKDESCPLKYIHWLDGFIEI